MYDVFAFPLSEIALVEISASVVYSLEDFMELQEETVSFAKNRLASLRESIITVGLSACKVRLLINQFVSVHTQETKISSPFFFLQIVAESKGILGLTEDTPQENGITKSFLLSSYNYS